MKKVNFITRKLNLFMALVLFCGTTALAQTSEQQEVIDDAQNAKQAFIEEDQYMASLFEDSEGYVIFPNVGEGAYIVGVASGNGAVYQNGKLIGMADLKQVDIGLQFGGKAYREVIFFNSEAAMEEFKDGEFSLSGNVSAVVLEEGLGKTVTFKNGIAVVTMPKAGAMIDISVGGQKLSFEPLP